MIVKIPRQRDLQLQLLALYLLFVGPIFVLAFFFYFNESHRLRQDVTAADLSLARAIALETDAMLLKAKESVMAFAQLPAVIEADPVGMETAFAAGTLARQDINLFYRLSAEGVMVYHYPPSPNSTVGYNFSFRPYFQLARQTEQHLFSRGRISPTTGRPVVTSVMPVFKAGQFDGLVATNLELKRLTETVQVIGAQRTHGRGMKIIIVNAAGQAIAHSETNKLLENVNHIPGVKLMLAGQEGVITDQDETGIEWLYTYIPMPNVGWGVIVQHPTEVAFASLNSFQNGLVLALIIFSVGAFFFWIILARLVVKPLEKLTYYGETVGQQNFEANYDRPDMLNLSKRPDQIGRLTRALLHAEQHLRQRLMELTTLNKTSAAVLSTLNTKQVINTILDEVQRLLQVNQCSLLIINETNQQLEIRASRGLSKHYINYINIAETSQKFPAYRAIVSGEPVQVPDMESEPKVAHLVTLAQAEGFRSVLVIPLIMPHVCPAALTIYRPTIHYFSKQEIHLATSFAHHAALALEHATLFSLTDAELQKRVHFLSILNRVGHTVSQSLVVDDVLNNAIETVFEVMPATACWIYTRRETEDFLRLRVFRGLPEKLVQTIQAQPPQSGEGMMEWVAQNGQPLLLNQLPFQRHNWLDDPIIAYKNWQSLVAAPVVAKDTTIGVLGMAAQTEPFSEMEVELLQAVSDQIAIAVVNARLYRRSREVAILEERNRVAREIHDTLAQGFAGILIHLRAAERLSGKRPAQAVESLREAQDLAHQSLQEARRSVLNLRPTVLENLTLDQAIAQQVARFGRESGLQADFILTGYPVTLKPDIGQNLYRIAQEALFNVKRHAQATRVTVTLTFETHDIQLVITDDGIGLTKKSPVTNGAGALNGGFGLVGIKERVNLLGGQIIFETPDIGGTQIKVTIPK